MLLERTALKVRKYIIQWQSFNGHRMDKAGRSEVGRRSVGGWSAVGERRSEVGRRSVGGRSEVDRAPYPFYDSFNKPCEVLRES